jgi:hypothetical protein
MDTYFVCVFTMTVKNTVFLDVICHVTWFERSIFRVCFHNGFLPGSYCYYGRVEHTLWKVSQHCHYTSVGVSETLITQV